MSIAISELLSKVSEHYDLGECSFIKHIYSWGTHVRIVFSSAKQGKLLLKERPYFLQPYEFGLHLYAQHYLTSVGGPVSRLVSNNKNDLVLCWKERHFSVQKWIESRPVNFDNERDLQLFGETAGKFLNLLARFKGSANECDWQYPVQRSHFAPDTWQEIYKFVDLIDDAIKAYQLTDNKNTTKWIRSWILNIGKQIANLALPEQFVHGDMQRFNCLVNQSGESYLIDLDRMHWSHRICDIAYASSLIGGFNIPDDFPQAHIREDWNWHSINVFREAIQQHVSLASMEEDHFTNFLGLQLVRNFIGGLDLDSSDVFTMPHDFIDQLHILAELLTQIK